VNEAQSFEQFKEALRLMEIGENEVIYLINSAKELQNIFQVNQYLDILLSSIPESCTLVMQTFNWDFCKGKNFSSQKTPSQTGLMSELYRRMDGVIRSPHPIYSFCAKGPMAEEICQHDGETCWGDNTPFEKLVEKNALILNFAKDFPLGITLIHRFEQIKRVPYRFFKTFQGIVDFGNGEREYETKKYVRDLTMNKKCNWEAAAHLLRERRLVKFFHIGFSVSVVRAKDFENVFYECLERDPEIFLIKG